MRTPIQGKPSLELAILNNSLIRKRLPMVENTCPSKLIKLTCQKLKEIEELIALIPKTNWNINGRNKRTIIINIIMAFLYYIIHTVLPIA